jgi:condensin complex subunit 1
MNITEYELTCHEDRLFSQFHPLVAYIVANSDENYSHPLLRETAILCFCRYLTISSQLCEQYLPLFFTVLTREENPNHRITMMITIGDLCIRYPNLIEPWTHYLYTRLQDISNHVRENTLMILIHLILNDMIKVKGQVSAVVLCLIDTDEKIRSLTQLFFTELAKRSNNPVYNLLGDIIGNLSREHEVEEEEREGEKQESQKAPDKKLLLEKRELTQKEFQEIMVFLLSFVTKDKYAFLSLSSSLSLILSMSLSLSLSLSLRQADSLLERLLMRMIGTDSVIQKRYLSYCISRLPVTDKGVKKMTELLRSPFLLIILTLLSSLSPGQTNQRMSL